MFSVYIVLYLAFAVYSILLFIHTEDTKIPKKSNKIYFIYKHGEIFLKGMIATAILGLSILFVLFIANNVRIIELGH